MFKKGFAVFLLALALCFILTIPSEAVEPLNPEAGQSEKNDESPPLYLIQPRQIESAGTLVEIPLSPLPKALPGAVETDPVLQTWGGDINMPSPLLSFEGISNEDNNNVIGFRVLPPDTNGDVGPNHYVQMLNIVFAIWDKSGNLIYGPVANNTLWAGFGGPCETTNNGDPIVLYDPIADRWLLSQFSIENPAGPYYQCIAISTTGDPTGSYYRYAFTVHPTKLNDYPKFGVWPDAYYMSVNQFDGGGWAGAGAFAFDRANMLAGSPASFIYFDLYGANPNFGGMLPSDLDGAALPPAGAPNYFAEVDDSTWIGPNDAFRIWEFHVDWVTPANSTFGIAGQPNATLNTSPWTPMPCVGITRDCIPQPGVTSSAYLDAIGDRLMNRLQYRNFGSYQTLVTNHTVDAGSGRAGIRWYELRKSGGGWSIYQEGTYAPADTEHRWMGSIAMDGSGNISLGYSVSSSSVYPSIRYVGRLAADPLGTLPQGETTLIGGGFSQYSTSSRWGDYSMMAVDPSDDCTFWYTQEYYAADNPNTTAEWQTRIGSFKFPACSGLPDLIVSSLAAGVRTYGTPMVRGVFANYMVTNQGSADADGSCLDFYLSRDSVLGAGDVYVGRENIAGLAAGNSYGRSVGYRLPSDKLQPASGTWRVIAEADACDDNDESDETNNQTSTVAGIVVK